MDWVRVGAISGFMTIGLGAFGAHALEERLDEDMQAIWQTAVEYQGAHALALVLFGVLVTRGRRAAGQARSSGPGWAFLLGSLLFSGSLYGLALDGPRWLGPVTPLGGLAFLVGWGWLAVSGAGVRGAPGGAAAPD